MASSESIGDALIQAFRAKYSPPQPPQRSSLAHELIALCATDGLRRLAPAPAVGVEHGIPPQGRQQSRRRYLWVIDDSGVPYVLEVALASLSHYEPKHTNLTGGGQAYIGGELWFNTDILIYISGGSGRYPPRDEEQLKDAEMIFTGYGYDVHSLGWDYDTDTAERVYKE